MCVWRTDVNQLYQELCNLGYTALEWATDKLIGVVVTYMNNLWVSFCKQSIAQVQASFFVFSKFLKLQNVLDVCILIYWLTFHFIVGFPSCQVGTVHFPANSHAFPLPTYWPASPVFSSVISVNAEMIHADMCGSLVLVLPLMYKAAVMLCTGHL